MSEEKAKPQLHMSRVNRILKCGQQDYYVSIEGLRMPPGIKLVVGTETHKTVEANLNNKIATGKLLPVEQVVDMAADGMKTVWDTQEIAIDDDEDRAFDQVKAESIDRTIALSQLHAIEVAPQLEPKILERKWVVELPNYPFDLAGAMDIEVVDGGIIDVKTKGKSPTSDEALIDDKLDMYGLAKKVIDGIPAPWLQLDFLVHYITPKRGDVVTKAISQRVVSTPERNRRTMAKVERAMEVIEKGIYTPAPPDYWICSKQYCGFWRICPFWSGK